MFISFIKYLLDPFNIFWILLLVTFGTWFFKKERLFKWLAITSGICFLLISTPLLPNMVMNSLERQYMPLFVEELPNRDAEFHIVILGAGHGFAENMPANTLLANSALRRLSEGIRLHRQLPNSKLVLSGYSSVGGITGAEMLQKTALLLGVDKETIILQKEPLNTFEEAKVYAENYGSTHPVILVTNAAHMPRAMMTFKQHGVQPLASPTDYRLKGSRRNKWFGFPEMSHIEKLRAGVYEYIGILYYKLR